MIHIAGRDELPRDIVLGAGESLTLSIVVLPGVSVSEELTLDLSAPGASARILGLYVCKGNERVSINVRLTHSSGECTSSQLFKGIVGGEARANFNGRILVARDSQKTRAFQENHTILLSDKARVEARPELEIYADDVECSHGATSGYLSPDELFYMRSRGIPEEEARMLQMISFLSPVMEGLPSGLKEEILSAL